MCDRLANEIYSSGGGVIEREEEREREKGQDQKKKEGGRRKNFLLPPLSSPFRPRFAASVLLKVSSREERAKRPGERFWSGGFVDLEAF